MSFRPPHRPTHSKDKGPTKCSALTYSSAVKVSPRWSRTRPFPQMVILSESGGPVKPLSTLCASSYFLISPSLASVFNAAWRDPPCFPALHGISTAFLMYGRSMGEMDAGASPPRDFLICFRRVVKRFTLHGAARSPRRVSARSSSG